ncbi:MAG TPA: hypothetical protein VGR60_09975, partial [Gemmatimonadales bacterium]|nr:hypothetical protein [Gemmatimonadales bacterium]
MPIYSSGEGDTIDVEGTATLIRLRDSGLLVSAGHVFDSLRNRPIIVLRGSGQLSITGNIAYFH